MLFIFFFLGVLFDGFDFGGLFDGSDGLSVFFVFYYWF